MAKQTVLKEFALADGVLYGPIKSRRLGSSLGINILPFSTKVCSFNCGYCQCGWTYDLVENAHLEDYPSSEEIEQAVADGLSKLVAKGEKVDYLTLAGNGEPTLHPDFYNVVKGIIRSRDGLMPSAKVTILSNAATVAQNATGRVEKIIVGLNLLDERIMKLDVGNDEKLLDINTPTIAVTLDEIIEGIKKLKDVILQTMFVQGNIDNTTEKDINDWMSAITRIGRDKVRYVQIYTVDRVPANAKIQPVAKDALERICYLLKEKTGINGIVY
ncbi:MAG: hypothetical protein A2W23_04620 [Planctomycetes bacterium RBG_16_43_13]|nr:MAG: hypothetical protein A2W23_04620 [Planctomycetes bacterium RBG_16_43_13]